MKTNIATAVLNVSDSNVVKNAFESILKIAPDKFQEFVTELLLGSVFIPNVFPDKAIKNGVELTFQELLLGSMAVRYTFEVNMTRFFASQEKADIAIEKCDPYSGDRTQSDDYPIEAVITYTDYGVISLKEWLELSKQGE